MKTNFRTKTKTQTQIEIFTEFEAGETGPSGFKTVTTVIRPGTTVEEVIRFTEELLEGLRKIEKNGKVTRFPIPCCRHGYYSPNIGVKLSTISKTIETR